MNPEEALHHYFGFNTFRPEQDHVVETIVDGKDVMVVMPTGGGKSLCYQLPALLNKGVTIVISPLIALMKDQVDALNARNIPATLINSTVSYAEQKKRLLLMEKGEYKLVYIAPERFRNKSFTSALRRINIAFFAIDEAHCVSLWGHDFRPDYLKVGEAIEQWSVASDQSQLSFQTTQKRPLIAAFTATATLEVRNDIIQNLRMQDPEVFVTGFGRPNLDFRVTHAAKDAEKYARLSAVIEAHKTGIIYCATRKRVDEVAERLQSWQTPFIAYHGGMSDLEREEAQNIFLNKKADIAVSTNAFGMGIDRSDIRFVVHFEIPGSIEAYYQEAGRAGRDGLSAVCEILYGHQDRRVQEFFIDGSNPSIDLIRAVYGLLRDRANENNEVALSIQDIAEALDTNEMVTSAAISLLNRQGLIQRFDIQGVRTRGTRFLYPELRPVDLPLDRQALEEKKRRDLAKLETMIGYCVDNGCRQEKILHYFGEKNSQPCGRCDCCQKSTPTGMREPNAEEIIILKKALSGVARMSFKSRTEGWIPRFGKNRIIEMLTGSRKAEIIQSRCDKLSTYGLLKELGTDYVRRLFNEILRAGLICNTGGRYPMVTLTPFGEAVLFDREKVMLSWPDLSETDEFSITNSENIDLFEALRKKRRELADAHGVPSWKIFPDRTLKALAVAKPLTKQEALCLPGIKKFKANLVLPHFLKLIAEHSVNQSRTKQSK